jgi:prepilin-type processing-associated H-X9-DG protein
VDATPGRFDSRASQVAFYRHAKKATVPIEAPRGAANFAFADGHVAWLRQGELGDNATGRSTYRALWSTIDRELE